MYFLIMTVSNIVNKKLLIVFFLSIILGPLFNYISSSWGVLLAGLISGTVGFIFYRVKHDK